ncbi:M35 family metallo-endopeptidase [Polyangium mundeleinium]|uniref:M35 family metallo-endopeptidase n=1 Tax=Polyangium mundeleinium TaxID=2995306 RepID=A0ABT5F1P2_9BACT|nr:M35 family metallo-endopeptidase [Polyangium mundeleinium]MDC0748007.1 M35 family metallo-endopeptidase [Polyangium mundeleinium]
MSKAATDRFDEALKTLEDFCVQRQNPSAYFGVLNWLQKQPSRDTARATIGARISLDTHGPPPADRKLARAFLLVSATCENKGEAQVGLLRQELLAAPKGAFGAKVQTMLNAALARQPHLPGAVVLDATLQTKIAEAGFAKANILDAFETAKFVLGKAKLLLDAGQCNAAYQRWFGPMEASRYNTVKGNISNLVLAAHAKPVVIRYLATPDFGSTEKQTFQQYSGKREALIALGDKFFGANAGRRPRSNVYDLATYSVAVNNVMELNEAKAKAEADVLKQAQKLADVAKQTEVMEAGFKKIEADIDTKRKALVAAFKDDYVMGYTGVIVHELSHHVAGTIDVKADEVTMYGYNLCRYLAAKSPATAIKNADNYRLFCDEFLPA